MSRRPNKPLTIRRILAWADAHHELHGEWPLVNSGPIEGAPGETWSAIDSALRTGYRGLPKGSSLFRLLREWRGVKDRRGRRSGGASDRRAHAIELCAQGLGFAEIGRRLGITRQAVAYLLRGEGGPGPLKKVWQRSELRLLGKVPDAELASRFGRTVDAVGRKRRELRILLPPHLHRRANRSEKEATGGDPAS